MRTDPVERDTPLILAARVGADARRRSADGTGGRPRIRVIFVCTGNSARSQMAEALLRREGGERFEVVSAGVDPRGVHPLTVRALARAGIEISDARSKSVTEFLGRSFDYVITVCDRARESCPIFPGGAHTLHWDFDDPAEARGTEADRLAVFERVLGEISSRIHAFIPQAQDRE